MPSFTKSILAGFACTLAFTGGARADDCTDGPVDQLKTWGEFHEEGIGFCHTGWTGGSVVTGVEVWSNKFHITGIQLTYSDGTKPPSEGAQEGDDHAFINWAADEPITAMRLATSKDGHALGLVYIEAGGKTLDVRSNGIKEDDEEDVNIASGILLGASGSMSAFVREWTPLFLGQTEGEAQITELKLDQSLEDLSAKDDNGIEEVALKEIYITNNNEPSADNSSDMAWNFQGSSQVTSSHSLSSTQSHTFGVTTSLKVSVEAGVPAVASKKVEFGIETSYQYQNSVTETEDEGTTDTLSWLQGSSPSTDLIKPGEAKHCKATTFKGTFQGSYTSTVEIRVKGKTFTFNQRGELESVSYTEVYSGCTTIKADEVPGGAETLEADDEPAVQDDEAVPEGNDEEEVPEANNAAPVRRAVKFFA